MKPRDYQDAAVNAVWHYFSSGKTGNPIVAMPTGTGKSLVQALMIKSFITAYPATRVLCLTHVKELIENNWKTLMKIMPAAPAGVYSAGLGRRDVHAQVTFAGIASIAKRVRLFSKTDLIIIDECHLVSDNESTRYAAFIKALKVFNPYLKVIGLSATPFRLGMGHLTDGELFDDVCFDLTSGEAFVWMVENGYLSPVVPKRPRVEIDTESVMVRGGEFVARALNESIDAQGVITAALREAIEIASDRKHWLVFTSSIQHCEEVTAFLNEAGISARMVHSKMKPASARDENIAAFLRGEVQALVNKDILTTGFDAPLIDCVIMLRPTQSPGLWVQMLGRATRPVFADGYDLTTAEGRLAAIAAGPKQDCLVLDFAGNTMRLGPINYPAIPKKKGSKGGGPPVRECPECQTMVHISIKECPECGYAFPPPEHMSADASVAALIATEMPKSKPPEYAVFKVTEMMAERHRKPGKPDSVKVSYYCGVRRFNVWVGVEHTGGMYYHSRKWWQLHSAHKNEQMPTSTDQLLEVFNKLRRPTHIKVLVSRKYPEVTNYDFTNRGFVSDTQQVFMDGSAGASADPSPDSGSDRSRPPVPELPDLSDFR